MENLCFYTTHKHIITQLLTLYVPCKILPFLIYILLSQNVFANYVTGLKYFSNFCHSCGPKVELDTVSAREMNEGAIKCLSFKNYAAKKRDERSTHFRSSGSKKKGQKNKEEDP